ncbi:Com family DNA-binding transcriptional regulator [Pseudomonas fluorescens]|nr:MULTISPECIES: Com family DNA-binding transcriptional regulator [Pseudomonas]MBT2340639.1 Com family DNA-binding transcriptional regulator [Pseudomonas fluorescens]MCD4531916.1 Com family DNA-binding transcriptional regulator [Pseudomonas sp. C3-2018]
MLRDFRCGHCKRLLARVGENTELQIKCSRCGTLNHGKALEPRVIAVERGYAEFTANQCSTSIEVTK